MFSQRPAAWRDPAIESTPRIGITKAAELPWRFTRGGQPVRVAAGAAGGAGCLVGVLPAAVARAGLWRPKRRAIERGTSGAGILSTGPWE